VRVRDELLRIVFLVWELVQAVAIEIRSPAPISKKGKYFGVRLETLGNSGPQFAKSGA
jgi:hypothetical protein